MKHFLIFFILLCFAKSVSNITAKSAIDPVIKKPLPITKQVIAVEQLSCLVQNAYHEAFGEGVTGVLLVTQVVLNRAKIKKVSYCSVVFEEYQFSWTLTAPKKIKRKDWVFLERVITEFYIGLRDVPKEFKTATHFHANYVNPYWADQLEFLGSWKNHLFYREDMK